ncbi:MAG: hypothetical protein IT582_00030, partial [Opitutaceae bacterium]|nr:hypothetical protein [Opitutaceae bacterium]
MNIAWARAARHGPGRMESATNSTVRTWSWVPTLYFGQGLPYVAVMTLS